MFERWLKREENMKRPLGWVGIAFAGLVLLLTAAPAFSQSCALCYTQAASSGARMIQALKSGILVLIIPPTLGSIGMVFVIHSKRNQVRRMDDDDDDDEAGQE
jgi:hypothetical protein